MSNTLLIPGMFCKYTVFFIALPPSFCRRCPLRIFEMVFFAYSTPVLHRESMQVDCGSWIRWLVSRIRICADKLGGGWERDKVQRTAKPCDDDGHGKNVGLRLPLLFVVIMTARALPPQRRDVEWQRKEAQGENTRSSVSCNDTELHYVLSTY